MVSIDAHGGPTLPEDRVHAIVRRSLERSPSFTPAERDQRSGGRKDTLLATLEYRELPDATDHGRDLLVRLSVQVPEPLEGRLGPDGLDCTVLLEREAGQADLAADLQQATDRLSTVLQARADVALGTAGAVERLLGSGDTELITLTLEWLRDHPGEPTAIAAADQVVELIGLKAGTEAEEEVGLLALEAIGQIGGPEHVPTVLAHVQLSNPTQVSRAYDAIARLGGPDAEAFLEFAARNEEEPDQRAAAQRALKRVANSEGVPTLNRGHR